MFDLIIRQARLANGSLTDIAIHQGKIAALGEQLKGDALQQCDLNCRYWLSAGWIDSHVHCYPGSPIYHDQPDCVGVEAGVTTVVDAGSTGADEVEKFYQLTRSVSTQVYALLNISRTGILTQNELADMAKIDAQAIRGVLARLPDFILGFKARMSGSVVGDNGIKPLIRAKSIQRENGNLPLMVHIGNNPPDLDEIADLLSQGDIITHCYHGKSDRILAPAGELRASVKRALQRGVSLDVGHGSASFSFDVARIAIEQGILPHTISSDIYCRNRISGPVNSLAHVMSKFLNIGMTLPQVIDCVTAHAAIGLHLKNKGQLQVGSDADLTLFDIREETCLFTDAEGQSVTGEKQLIPLAAIVGGRWFTTDEGKKHHVFDL